MTKSLVAALAATFLLTTATLAQDASTGLTLNGPSSEVETGSSSVMPTSDVLSSYTRVDTDRLSSKIVGSPVYSSTAADAEKFGDIKDLILDANGQIVAVVIGVGGFLGLGEKNVAVNYSALQWTVAADNTERYVLATTKDALTNAPDFQTVDDEPGDASASAGGDTSAMTTAPMDSSMMDSSAMSSTMAPATDTTSSAMDTMSSAMSAPMDTTSSMMSSGAAMGSSAMDSMSSMGSSAMDSMSTSTSMAPATSSAM